MRPHQAAAPAAEEIAAVIEEHVGREGPLLPMLHAMQETFGHVPQAAIPMIAAALNQTRAEIHGVVSFYHDFREAPAGRHVLRICRAEACQSVGGEAAAAETLARLGVDWHGTTADGAVTVEPVYCLGLCACGPAAQLDAALIGRAGPERIAAALAEAGAGAGA
ncbi:formate dehydrogenase subunit gamma [Amaricoccus sp.]|uniref:formate dehydrogenase subunit gamma n=1 Tax=Amaricoccus sp. TaxID=1872485 RepID=UPI001B725860|nr:formate dehydrogenase subunit gamma [Amaricoccus sp.]MBP7001136.1 formate dehydrogenase subunit gamma [Amaricoccus sp.]